MFGKVVAGSASLFARHQHQLSRKLKSCQFEFSASKDHSAHSLILLGY